MRREGAATRSRSGRRRCKSQGRLVDYLSLCGVERRSQLPSSFSQNVAIWALKGVDLRIKRATIAALKKARSFVFKYFLASFPRFSYTENERDQRPSPWGEGGESSEPGEGFLPVEPRNF